MTTASRLIADAREKLPWLAIVKFLLLAAFVGGLLLLGLSMANHRFFRGGHYNQHGVLTP